METKPVDLKEARKAKGLTQEQVAAALGTDGGTVSRWECGKIEPSAQHRHRYAELLGMTVEELGAVIYAYWSARAAAGHDPALAPASTDEASHAPQGLPTGAPGSSDDQPGCTK